MQAARKKEREFVDCEHDRQNLRYTYGDLFAPGAPVTTAVLFRPAVRSKRSLRPAPCPKLFFFSPDVHYGI